MTQETSVNGSAGASPSRPKVSPDVSSLALSHPHGLARVCAIDSG